MYIIPPNPKGKVNYLLIFIEGFSAVTAFPLKPPQKAAWDQKIPGLSLIHISFENKVRTFCMNPGGIVSEEHYEGGVGGKGIAVVNGHSYADEDKHSENTNFAMLVSTKFTEPFNQPIEYGRYIAQLANMLTCFLYTSRCV